MAGLIAADPELQRVREVSFAALRLGPGQRILDACCASGPFPGSAAGDAARLLAARLGGAGEVVALTRPEAPAHGAAGAPGRHDGGRVRHHPGDVTALDFPDGHFDAARCERVLRHLADPGAAVAELARVTRPGGRLCLVDTDWESVAVDGLPRHLVAAVRGHLLATVLRTHPDMGRTVRRRLVRAGVREVTAVPVALYFADPLAAATALPMVNPMVPPQARLIPDELRDDWFGAVSEAAERGDFLATLTMWVAAGTV